MFRKFVVPVIFSLALASNAATLTGKGKFKKKAHKIKGSWYLVEVEGRQLIAFSDRFKIKDGADLIILLSKRSVADLEETPKFTEAVAFARLKKTSGEQHYILPDDINIEDYKSVLIHNEKTNRLWGGFNIPDQDLLEERANQDERDDIANVIENNEGAIRVGL